MLFLHSLDLGSGKIDGQINSTPSLVGRTTRRSALAVLLFVLSRTKTHCTCKLHLLWLRYFLADVSWLADTFPFHCNCKVINWKTKAYFINYFWPETGSATDGRAHAPQPKPPGIWHLGIEQVPKHHNRQPQHLHLISRTKVRYTSVWETSHSVLDWNKLITALQPRIRSRILSQCDSRKGLVNQKSSSSNLGWKPKARNIQNRALEDFTARNRSEDDQILKHQVN